jgi:ABC-type uncharacterized transport system substrate-binding protein
MNRPLGPLVFATAVALSAPALAHPHVFIVARAEVIYAPDGRVTGVRQAWTFDQGYSAFLTQGLDKNGDGTLAPDEMQGLADENTAALADFGYFTVLKANGSKQDFDRPREARMSHADAAVTLEFLLPLKAPATASKALSLEVYDPTFFISFSLAPGADAIRLAGAPKGCATTVSRPKTLAAAEQQNLSEAFFQTLTGASGFGQQFASRAIIACP